MDKNISNSEQHGWIVARETCRICSHTTIAVIEVPLEVDSTECPNCGNMTMDIDYVYDKQGNMEVA